MFSNNRHITDYCDSMISTTEKQRKSLLWKLVSSASSFLLGGGALGFGIGVILIMQILPPILEEKFDIQFDPQATIGLLNAVWIMILFGVIMTVVACVEVYMAYNTMQPKTVVEPKIKGKFFCRYCGKENKPDAIYCEGCGKNL